MGVISYVTAFVSRNLLQCQHIERKSLRLLREDNCGLYRIKYFSHEHSWQLLVRLFYGWGFLRTFQDIVKFRPLYFKDQMCLLNLVNICRNFFYTAFKTRYYNHLASFRHPTKRLQTELIFLWKLQQ